MAIYETDFSEYTAGSPPSDWTDRYNTNWTVDVEDSSGRLASSIGDQCIEVDTYATTDNPRLLSWDDIDSDANRDDVEILARIETPSWDVNDTAIALTARASGGVGTENYCSMHVWNATLNIRLYENGSETWIWNAWLPKGHLFDDHPFWYRFRVNGNILRAKAWSVALPEPVWQLEVKDSIISGVGWTGFNNLVNADPYYLDYFAVGTNGDSPPLPCASTGNVQLNATHLEVAYVNDGNQGEPPVAIETLMLEGFDTYTVSSQLVSSKRWVEDWLTLLSTNNGREGGGCFSVNLTSNNSWVSAQLPAAQRTIVIGFAFYVDALPNVAGYNPLRLLQGTSGFTSTQIVLELRSDGKFELWRGAKVTSLEIGTTVMQTSSWYYVELRVYIDNTLGEYELKLDGVTEFSATGVDTQEHATENDIQTFTIRAPDYNYTDGGKSSRIDDLYVRGDTVNTAGGFLGDVRIVPAYPDANGSNRDFTLSTGTDDFAVLDEKPVSSTDYAYSSTAADQITCGMEEVTGDITIQAVALLTHTKIGASGARDFKPVCKSGATTDVGTARRALENVYTEQVIYEDDPNTASPWAQANLNAAEFGIEVV